jgi:hypothetical protein
VAEVAFAVPVAAAASVEAILEETGSSSILRLVKLEATIISIFPIIIGCRSPIANHQ